MNKTLLALITLIAVNTAQAGIALSPSFTHITRELTDNNNPTQEASLTMIDIKLGYIFEMGLYVGGLYSLIEDEITSMSSDFHFGPSIGYFNSGFFVVGTYYVFGQRDLDVGNTKYDGASGFQLDLAYVVPVNKTFSIGPQLTYQSVKYDDAQVAGLSSDTSYEWKGMTPYIALMFNF